MDIRDATKKKKKRLCCELYRALNKFRASPGSRKRISTTREEQEFIDHHYP